MDTFADQNKNMATLREYYDTDFTRILNIGNTLSVANDIETIDIPVRIHLDFDSSTKFLSFYLPKFS